MAELTPAERRDQRIAEAKRSAAEKRGETFAPGDAGASPTPPAGPAAEEVEELGNITQAAGELELEADASSTETNSVEEVAAAGDDNQSLADDTSTPPESEPIVGTRTPVASAVAAPAASAAKRDNEPREEPKFLRTDIRSLNRREFLTYSWAAAVGIVSAQSLVATGLLMYPRFRAGEFGGDFAIGSVASLPAKDSAPQGDPIGKFWLINTEEGPRALYMVCTHLGCLYKWVEANRRFECPCHGSKFTREGIYIEGPAPRGLDQFVVELQDNGTVVGSTESLDDQIHPPVATSDGLEIIVKTGTKIQGKSHS